MSAALRFSKTTPADSPERVSGKAFQAPKTKTARFAAGRSHLQSGPIRVRAQEPVRALAQEPGLAQVPVREQGLEQAPVRRASLARRAQVRAPVCWRPEVQPALPVRHSCRKHSKRQWPG